MPRKTPRKRDRMDPGRPFDELTEEERAAQNPDDIYIDSLWDWMANDLSGRRMADVHPTQGPHQPFPGRSHSAAARRREVDPRGRPPLEKPETD